MVRAVGTQFEAVHHAGLIPEHGEIGYRQGDDIRQIFVLVAAGLSLIFGVTRIVNFAHGSFYMVGIYVAYSLVEHLGGAIGFWPALQLPREPAMLEMDLNTIGAAFVVVLVGGVRGAVRLQQRPHFA
jgi:ABC-type branched-subunit amino acid transport system permease subunit